MTATINVTPRACNQNCATVFPHPPEGEHWGFCAAAQQVLIPCPIPRSVTFEVALGECTVCPPNREGVGHFASCAAYPIRVSCSISGKTWAESEVTEARSDQTQWQPPFSDENRRLLAACRARWALVKALGAGRRASDYGSKDGEGWCGHSLRAFANL